jgi:hypothetical protein
MPIEQSRDSKQFSAFELTGWDTNIRGGEVVTAAQRDRHQAQGRAGYDYALMDGGEIDMHGIAVIRFCGCFAALQFQEA